MNGFNPANPLIIQGDYTLLVEVDSPRYEEVHVLPAPIFQVTAGLQARRRLGLTATLVREDGREEDVFALIIGMFVEQLQIIANDLRATLITGKTPQKKRDLLFDQFKKGVIKLLVVSKVANFALDLPDAALAIQVSGTFGSRQEEAQRLGRILRPKPGRNEAHFYTLVSRDTIEQEYAHNRQLFLCEQGYSYAITDQDQEGRSPRNAGEAPRQEARCS